MRTLGPASLPRGGPYHKFIHRQLLVDSLQVFHEVALDAGSVVRGERGLENKWHVGLRARACGAEGVVSVEHKVGRRTQQGA